MAHVASPLPAAAAPPHGLPHGLPQQQQQQQHHLTHAERRLQQDEQRAHKAAAAMADPCELILIRHGETAWNKEGRLQGQQQPGPPLDELGLQQAAVLARALHARFPQLDAVFASDLLRAVQTAELLAVPYGLEVQQHPGLRERHMGVLQGLTYTEAPHVEPTGWAAMQSSDTGCKLPGGGESLDDVRSRLTLAVLDIARLYPGKRVCVVSHGGALHAVHRAARGYAAKGKVVNCSISVLMAEADAALSRRSSAAALPAPPPPPPLQQQQQQQQQPDGAAKQVQQQQQQQQAGACSDGAAVHIAAVAGAVLPAAWCDAAELCEGCTRGSAGNVRGCWGGRVTGGRLALLTWNDSQALQAEHVMSATGFGGSQRAG